MGLRGKQIEQLLEIYAIYDEWGKSKKDYYCFKKATDGLKELINNANGQKHNQKPYIVRFFLYLILYFCLFFGVSSIIDSSGNLLPVNFVLSVLFACQKYHNRWNDDMLALTEFVVEALRFSNMIQDEYFKTIYRDNRPVFALYTIYNRKRQAKRRLVKFIVKKIKNLFALTKDGKRLYGEAVDIIDEMGRFANNYDKDNIGKYGKHPLEYKFLQNKGDVVELMLYQNYYGIIFDKEIYLEMYEYIKEQEILSSNDLVDFENICGKIWRNC